MTGQPNLSELVDLATAFNKAVAMKAQNNPVFLEKINSEITADEEQTMLSLANDMQQSMIDALTNPNLDEQGEQELQDRLDGSALQLYEIFASVVSRLVSDEKLATCVPAEGRTTAVSSGFQAHNAPTLARLFAP